MKKALFILPFIVLFAGCDQIMQFLPAGKKQQQGSAAEAQGKASAPQKGQEAAVSASSANSEQSADAAAQQKNDVPRMSATNPFSVEKDVAVEGVRMLNAVAQAQEMHYLAAMSYTDKAEELDIGIAEMRFFALSFKDGGKTAVVSRKGGSSIGAYSISLTLPDEPGGKKIWNCDPKGQGCENFLPRF